MHTMSQGAKSKTKDVTNQSQNLTLPKSRGHDLLGCEPIRYIYVTGEILLVFLLAQTSLVWLLQTSLGWDTNFYQRKWELLVDKDLDPRLFFSYGSLAVTMAVYWGWGGFYCLLDWKGWLSKYKVQPGTNKPLDAAKFTKAVAHVLTNQIVAIPFVLIAFHLTQCSGRLMANEQIRILPPFYRVLLELPFHIFCQEVTLYYSHVMLHHKSIYKYIHKKHHEWTAPIAIMTEYAHPLEHIFSNVFPVILGPTLLGSHPITAWFWFSYAVFHSLNTHSGYHLPLLQSPEFHDYHHLKFNQNYGAMGLMDHIHGTDSQWRQTKSKQRHFSLYSTVPVRKIVPDNKGE